MIPTQAIRNCASSPLRLAVLAALAATFVAVYWVSYWLRFEGSITSGGWEAFQATAVMVVLAKLAVFMRFGVHRGWTRYVSFHDLIQISKAATVGLLVFVLLKVLAAPQAGVPRTVFVLDWILSIAAIGGMRSISRLLAERDPLPLLDRGRTPVFIVGANASGEGLLRAIRRGRDLPYRVVGFITQHKADVGSCVDAVPVVGTIEQTCELAHRYGVPQVLITSGELSGQLVRRLVEDGRRRNVEVRVLPGYEQIISGNVSLQPRTVSIEDLLQRDPVELHTDELQHWIDGRTVLVTGSAGSIGAEICRQLLRFRPKKLVLVDRSENGQFFLERELRKFEGSCDLAVHLGDAADETRMRSLFA